MLDFCMCVGMSRPMAADVAKRNNKLALLTRLPVDSKNDNSINRQRCLLFP